MNFKVGVLLGAVGLFSISNSSSALTLDVQNGILMGASGVDVGGVFYDVQFVDGSCNSLFNNCDGTAFTFTTVGGAASAAQALLDQVFVDGSDGSFDSSPSLTNGCTASPCTIWTPYESVLMYAQSATTINGLLNNDGVNDTQLQLNYEDFTSDPINTYAVWTMHSSEIPEPTTLACFGIGLAAMGFVRRCSKRA